MNTLENDPSIREKILSELRKLVLEIDRDMHELQVGLDDLKKEVILRLAKDLETKETPN